MPEMSESKKRNLIIVGLCVTIMLMIVGYGALDQLLDIKGNAKVTTNWKILITKVDSHSVGNASNVEEPIFTDLTASFNASLTYPGDKMEYDVTVTNKGNIEAELETIHMTDSNNNAIIFTTEGLSEGDTLNVGESKILKVNIIYDPNTKVQPQIATAKLTVALDFGQAGKE